AVVGPSASGHDEVGDCGIQASDHRAAECPAIDGEEAPGLAISGHGSPPLPRTPVAASLRKPLVRPFLFRQRQVGENGRGFCKAFRDAATIATAASLARARLTMSEIFPW